jgi:hypothetical protein
VLAVRMWFPCASRRGDNFSPDLSVGSGLNL